MFPSAVRQRFRFYRPFVVIATAVILCGNIVQAAKTKRQLYREQVSPHNGGKIPDSAFEAERLAANRLNKEGITVPDGVLFEQRPKEQHHHHHRLDADITRNIVKITQTPDGRFTPAEGRFPWLHPVESTYLIRSPADAANSLIFPPFPPILGTQLKIPTRNFYPRKLYYGDPLANRLQHNSVYSNSQELEWNVWNNIFASSSFPNKNFGQFSPPTPKPVYGIIDGSYPSYTRVPVTSFACDKSGHTYADPEAKCQVFHVCHYDGGKETFLCPVGTRYDTLARECSPWYKTSCPPLYK